MPRKKKGYGALEYSVVCAVSDAWIARGNPRVNILLLMNFIVSFQHSYILNMFYSTDVFFVDRKQLKAVIPHLNIHFALELSSCRKREEMRKWKKMLIYVKRKIPIRQQHKCVYVLY